MSLSAKLRLGIVLVVWGPLATAQSTLGALLDAGAKKLSPQEFKEELVQRVIVGPTPAGTNLEIMYVPNGQISGRGTTMNATLAPVGGEWKIDDSGKICTSMSISMSGSYLSLPPRCQTWFKYNEAYFVSDSDSDRSARVLRRTVKQ